MKAARVAIPGKELGKDDFTKIPNGLPGIQDRMPVLWTTGVRAGRSQPINLWPICSTNPAKIFGLVPAQRRAAPGSDADIVIWDPEKKVKYGVAHSHQRTDYNLYEGWELTGYPEKVFLRGKLIVDGNEWKGKRGDGFLKERGRMDNLAVVCSRRHHFDRLSTSLAAGDGSLSSLVQQFLQPRMLRIHAAILLRQETPRSDT